MTAETKYQPGDITHDGFVVTSTGDLLRCGSVWMTAQQAEAANPFGWVENQRTEGGLVKVERP